MKQPISSTVNSSMPRWLPAISLSATARSMAPAGPTAESIMQVRLIIIWPGLIPVWQPESITAAADLLWIEVLKTTRSTLSAGMGRLRSATIMAGDCRLWPNGRPWPILTAAIPMDAERPLTTPWPTITVPSAQRQPWVLMRRMVMECATWQAMFLNGPAPTISTIPIFAAAVGTRLRIPVKFRICCLLPATRWLTTRASGCAETQASLGRTAGRYEVSKYAGIKVYNVGN